MPLTIRRSLRCADVQAVSPDQTIQQHGTAGLMEPLLKQYRTKRFIQALKQAADSGLLRLTVTHTTTPYFTKGKPLKIY